MVVDTSALVAMLQQEPEHEKFTQLLAGAEDPVISAGTLVEASIVMLTRRGAAGVASLDELLGAADVRCIAVDSVQAVAARDAFARYGKGRAPAALNFGDCFAYALARTTGRSLLFKGDEFSQTDITPGGHMTLSAISAVAATEASTVPSSSKAAS